MADIVRAFMSADKGTDEYIKKACEEFEVRWKNPTKNNAELTDFNVGRTLGAGAFGRVVIVQHIRNKTFYAMKILDKKKIMKMRQVEHIISEKQILQAINLPFLIRMHFTFKDTTNCYLVLEMMSGGDLFSYHRKVRKFGEPQAKLYSAQIVLAFEYLHTLDVVYRDLKPENIMIDVNGYLKVIDMGFAKRIKSGRTYTMCGTPDYIAPEIIQNKGYGKAVDWWTFGILIFEMVAGGPPFGASEHMTIYQNIVNGKYKVPSFFTENLRDLCKNIITADLTRRYGNLRRGVRDIKEHPWFAEIRWSQVYEKRYLAPYRPKVKSDGDTSNFGSMDETEMILSPTDLYTKEFQDF